MEGPILNTHNKEEHRPSQKFYTLVHPEPDYYSWRCQQVHGLGPADTDNAPNFKKAWNKIRGRIGNKYPLVAHNARFGEGCTRAAFEVYQMDYPEYQFHRRQRAGSTSGGITTHSRMPRPAQLLR